MNNTKRRIFKGAIAAIVCFTMIMGSFGAIIGAVFGLISNQDLIDAINNGSISVGDLALLASLNAGNLTIDGQDVTNVALDGYHAKNNLDEADDKEADYDTYNEPYYTAGVTSTSTTATIGGTEYTVKYAPASSYFGGTNATDDLEDAGVSGNLLIYCDISMRHGASDKTSGESVIEVKANANLVIAMATAEEILAGATDAQIQLKSAVFKDGLLGSKTVYGICLNRCYFELKAGASLTLLGRDFNGNGYIDDEPVEVTVTGENAGTYWFYEKIVLSGSSAYQDYEPEVGLTLNGGNEVLGAKAGIARPLISVYGGTDGSTTSAKLIISGADLRNNFNKKIPNVSGIDPGDVDDVVTGGGAIYLASGSANEQPRNTTTGGWFKEVIITNTRFSYCGAVRGGAIMVGKNFYSSTLDLSYCDYDHCYTAYYNYNSPDTDQGTGESDQSGDGGAVCFYQDDTTTEDWYATKNHNNPSLIYVGTADFTGSTFSFCYAMRAGGAIHFGGYHYNTSDFTENAAGHVTNSCGLSARPDMLGTQIKTLKLDFCDFYCCGAGWAMKAAPGISDSSFIFTSNVNKVSASGLFAGLEGVTDYVTAKDPDGDNLFTEVDPWGSSYPGLKDLQWLRLYDDTQVTPNTNTAPRNLHNWYNIPQMKFAGACREGGAIFFNCRVGEMSMKDCTFIYCAADSNGGAVFLDDRFVCPSAIVENCLFKNNMSNESPGGGSDTGTFRSTGLAAADIHFNNCSFLYNLNFGGGGALYLNLNNTYTSPYASNTTYNVAKPQNDATTQRNMDRCAGSEVNNCLFFGNFAIWSGAAIRCTGVMDINSSTFAHNISNNGYAGAIYFLTYERPLVDVGTEKAQMRFDVQYDTSFDGHTIVCYNEVGGTTSGGGGIAISATHSPSVGIPNTTVTSTDSAKTYTSRQYSFDFALNGVLVFNNTASGGGGGIYFRVNNDAAPTGSVVNAWVYDKNVNLNNGYVFDNYAYGVGGGVRVRDDCSVRDGATKVTISGANVYANESKVDGGGLYILAEGGIVNIEGGYVVANKAPDGAGIYIKDTNAVNITGGNVGISKYGAPTLTRGDADTTFTAAASATLAGGNVATGNGGGICIENAFTEETYFDNDTTVTMAGGIIEANQAGTGGGLYMVRGSVENAGIVNFTMNKSSDNSAYGFYGNTAANGAGIYASSNNATAAAQRYVVNLNGGEVAANVATTNGGGAFITGGAQLVVNGGIMDSNKANTQNGGAVYINSDGAEAVISNGQISNNYAAQHGGGIQAYDANLTVSGGKITGNESGTAGGGLAIRGSALLTMNGGTVSANTSVSGGGVFVSGATAKAEINGGTIGAGNTATNGGGIYANDSATVTMTGGKVDGNTATQNGGGIYVTTTENFTMNGGAISNNTATNGNGGGVCVEPSFLKFADGIYTVKIALVEQVAAGNGWLASNYDNYILPAFKSYLLEAGYDLSKISFVSKTYDCETTINGSTIAKTIIADDSYDLVIGAGGNNTSYYVDGGYTWVKNAAIIAAYQEDKSGGTSDNARHAFLFETNGQSGGTDLANVLYNIVTSNAVATALTPSKATISAGNITGNKALKGYGGGVCCNSATVNLTAPSNDSYPVINTNTAKNGGGVAVINSGAVTMQGGYVTGNSAKCVTANYVTNNNTSYQRHTDLEGVGGGIYVANATADSDTASFSIENYATINSGIYLNNAEFAADDVFANAVDTELSVPAFASMKIIGNAGKVTGWYEDYATGDVNYTIGLNGNKQADKTKYPIERYDKSPSDKVFEAWIDAADETADTDSTISTPTKYINGSDFVCVTLGAYIIYDGKLTIEKYIHEAEHLDVEQTFIFHVVRTHDSDGNALSAGSSEAVDLYVTINVTDTTNRKNSVTITSLPLGTYKVTEMTEWSWRYEVDATYTTVTATNGTAIDSDSAAEVVCTKLEMVSGTENSNDPTITFANVLDNDKWLDGNSPKVVNTVNSSSRIDISYVGGTNKATNVVLYANFKREETLI